MLVIPLFLPFALLSGVYLEIVTHFRTSPLDVYVKVQIALLFVVAGFELLLYYVFITLRLKSAFKGYLSSKQNIVRSCCCVL